MTTTNYLTNPRLNRNSGAKSTPLMQDKVLEHESLEYRVAHYLGRSYNVQDVILSDGDGNIIKVESSFSLVD